MDCKPHIQKNSHIVQDMDWAIAPPDKLVNKLVITIGFLGRVKCHVIMPPWKLSMSG